MRKLVIVLLLVAFFLTGCQGQPNGGGAEVEPLVLATTTSTYDSGLLHYLLPEFEVQHSITVDVISVGTGQAIEIGKRGDCDIILVHARSLEDEFVAEGYGTQRWDVMYNDYVLLGPSGDPGNVAASANLREALERMVLDLEGEGREFLSRGDNSGTHNKEKGLWAANGYPAAEAAPWYLSMGQGMGDTLIAANEMGGYTLADRGTYLAMKNHLPHLAIVFAGDEELFNPYGIIPVNPDKHPGVNHEGALLLVDFFTSPATQAKIGEFGVAEFGAPLFFPDAQ